MLHLNSNSYLGYFTCFNFLLVKNNTLMNLLWTCIFFLGEFAGSEIYCVKGIHIEDLITYVPNILKEDGDTAHTLANST